MDADIVINNSNSIWSMVDGLENSPYHPLAGALGIKDIELRTQAASWEFMSRAMSRMERDARHYYMCGGLYCGRGSFLRQLEFPRGFVCGDDSYLAYLAITNLLTTSFEFDRILHPDDATFVFEAYSTIPKLFKQHRRRLVGEAVRGMLYDYVRSKQSDGQPDAGKIIRHACKEHPAWLEDEVNQRVAAGFWVLHPRKILLRFTQLRRLSWFRKLARLPLACFGAVWSAGVILSANRMFRNGKYAGAWTNLQNTRLLPQSTHTGRSDEAT